jgi:hypothetical protein
MNSTPTPKQTAPHDIADAALKEAHEQIGRAAGQLVRNEPASDLQQDAADDPLDHEERAAVLLRQRPSRGLIGALLLTAFVCAAAFAWQSYGDAAMVIARWTPERVSASSLVPTKQEPPAPLSQVTVGVATADAPLSQPAPRAKTTPQDVPPKAAPVSPELARWLETIARDLANVEQGIRQLKSSHEQIVRDNAELTERFAAIQAQMARDNAAVTDQLKAAQIQMAHDSANAAEQFKAGQEETARLFAKVSEQNLRPKTSAPPRLLTTNPRRKPGATPPLQARAQPQAPKPEQQ